jgi:hypothetical protein
MATYNQKYNKDDSIVRHVIIGLLADLNNKLVIMRQLNAEERVVVDVPFYYAIAGDENFMRDNFLFTTGTDENCNPLGLADGNYDVVPRGVINMTGLAIDSDALVNKRNMGTYAKLAADNSMRSYSAEFQMIPVTVSFDIEIRVSSQLDCLKMAEMIIKTMYKSNYFNVEVGHLEDGTYRIASYYALPEDYEIQRPVEFSFEDKDRYSVTFPIEVKSFIPAFEWDTELNNGNRMFEIESYVTEMKNEPNIDRTSIDSHKRVITKKVQEN